MALLNQFAAVFRRVAGVGYADLVGRPIVRLHVGPGIAADASGTAEAGHLAGFRVFIEPAVVCWRG